MLVRIIEKLMRNSAYVSINNRDTRENIKKVLVNVSVLTNGINNMMINKICKHL